MTDIDDGWYMFDLTYILPPPIEDLVVNFREYLDALPDHEALLLKRLELLCGTVSDVCQKMKKMKDILLVSDGGAFAEYGSFGWVLCLKDGTRLAKGSGSVFGYDPKSYRAEGHGAKAGTLFMAHCFKYCHKKIPKGQFEFYCDNEGLLKKLEYIRSYKLAINATCLHSEWDIVSAVHRLHDLFSPPPDLIHVKGHQDDALSKDFLDLPSQLNVEADELATMELQEYGSIKSYVPFDPSTGALLTINGRTITRQLGPMIHNQHHLAPMRRYYRERFNWSYEDFESIDWAHYSIVYSRFPRHRTFFSKLGWKLLPIAKRLHPRTPSFDHRCPSCHQDHESDDHVYQCEHQLRAQWRISLNDQILDALGAIVDPDLLVIMRIGLHSYFTNSSPDFSARFPNGYSSSPYFALIDQQNSIGWDHFVRGKFSTEWSTLQYFYAKRYGLLKASEGWIITLIRLLANASYRLWEIRNDCRHGKDDATKRQALQEQTHREIRCIYLLQPAVLAQDRQLFRSNVDVHLSETIPQQRSWLLHNKKLIVHSVKVAAAQAKLQTHQIKHFFELHKTLWSKTAQAKNPKPPPRRQFSTRISNHFHPRNISIRHTAPLPARFLPNFVTRICLCTSKY